MVLRSASYGKKVPRDERIERGIAAINKHNHPWGYSAQVKSGRSRTERILVTAYNYTDMVGQLIRKAAKRGESLYISDVLRTNRYRSIIKDY